MDISIIIVNYNTVSHLDNCLDSIFKNVKKITFEVIVIDNDSKDNSRQMVKQKYPLVRLIENKKNVGFGVANNQGAKIAEGKYLLLLNSDTIVMKYGLYEIFQFIEKTADAGIVGGKVYLEDGTLQDSCRKFENFISEICLHSIAFLKFFDPFSNDSRMKKFDHNSIRKVDWVSGAYMLLRREAVEKSGLFDPDMFMYAEDKDLCMRVHKAGYNVYFVPYSPIYHFCGVSSKKQLAKNIAHCFRSSIVFHKKHYGKINAFFHKLIVSSLWSLISVSLNITALFSKNEKITRKKQLFKEMINQYHKK